MDIFSVEASFPTIIKPKIPDLDFTTLQHELPHHTSLIEEILLKSGAILFRDFPLHTADDFANFIEAINLGNFVNYIGGDSPRDKVQNKVYTSTETPPEIHLPLHQELSYIKYFPQHIYFFCEIAPVVGGETIIADARKVYKSLNPNVIKKFNDKKLMYISHYFYKSRIMALVNYFKRSHRSWIEVFETSNPQEVEKICEQNEIQWNWLRRNWIEIKQTRPALIEHPITNEMVWFNQAHLYDFNPRLLGLGRYLAAKLFYLRPSTRLHEIRFADGTDVPRKDLYHILDVLQENTVAKPWQKGDVMVLDNILTMHGRAPFKGKRRVLTALTKKT